MSELRRNPITKQWVIIAPERAKRPGQFQNHRDQESTSNLETSACPFCPGNEESCGEDLLTYYGNNGGRKGESRWSLRVVPNKYPALVEGGEVMRREEGTGDLFMKMDGAGYHEVVIEHPDHLQTIATMPVESVEGVIASYVERYKVLIRRPNVELVTIFRNSGPGAGTSIRHPHSQIIASPVVPMNFRHVIEETVRYYDTMGTCVYCDMIAQERVLGRRVVSETEQFIVIIPFFSRSPFETWILPKAHRASFSGIHEEEKKDLARVLIDILTRLYRGLDNPDYNYMIHSAPYQEDPADYYHWHLRILPRCYEVAGFELGSGIYLNTTSPEECARFLRQTQASE
jgi:UDPglucose--hexose-1-phosphate uridylyltransferase